MVKVRAKREKTGKYSLYLDIYDKGNRYKEYLKIQVSKDYTKEAKPKPKGDDIGLWELATRIRAERELQLKAEGFGIVLNNLKAGSFIDFFQKEIEKEPSKNKKLAFNHFKEYNQNKDVTFQQVTPVLVENFKKYLLQKVASTSAFEYFSKLKWVWNKALQRQIITNNPFNGVSIKAIAEKEIVYLNESEVQAIAQTKDVISEDIKQAFIFSCFCGLRVSDILSLEFAHIQNDRIEKTMVKTKELVSVPLNDTLRNILAKRDKSKKLVFEGLPHSSTINDKLKILGAYLHIDKNLHFHVGRHTFATMALTNGIDIYTVSKYLGHKDIKTTQRYAKIVDKKKEAEMLKMPTINI